MVMLGVGCRAPSAMLVLPAEAVMRLFPCCVTGNVGRHRNFSSSEIIDSLKTGSRNFSPSASRDSWRGGSTVRFWGQTVGLGGERIGKVAVQSLPQRFFVKAINVSGPGTIDSPLMQSMQTKIKEDLNAESVIVRDAYGDGRHVSIDVVASAFEGKSAVNRQRLVYKAIWEELQDQVHAVDQLKTRTPSEACNSPDQL